MEHLGGGRKGRAETERTFRRVDKMRALRHHCAMDPVLPLQQLPEGDLIVFDAACLFCSGFARFMHRHDRAGRFRFVTAQSPTGRALYRAHGLDPDRMETNIVITAGQAYIKLPAFAAAMRALGAPWSALSLFGRLPDPFYDWIARNRYRLGRRDCTLPPPGMRARLIE
jgi:predicted DCC family thiol-disulfide oxidoreductase YuxK